MSDEAKIELADEAAVPEPQARGFWKKLKRGLFMTHTEILESIEAAISGDAVLGEDTLDYLEEALIGADIGVDTALELIDQLKRQATSGDAVDALKLRQMLVDHLAVLLLEAPPPPVRGELPLVTLLVGVNGVGKTTSAAKLAHRARVRGEEVLLAAADTFRAAATEQLSLWAERVDADIVKQAPGADPGAVVFDALQAGRARGVSEVIVDTAGRLHNKENLMAELEKIKRVIERHGEGWDHRTILILDATTGQNGLSQAREFARSVDVDGVLLAKIDGTAKGGMVVAIARDLGLPVLFLGVGEGAEDLVEFRPREFASALLG